MALNPLPILRIVQGVLTLIVLGVSAYVVVRVDPSLLSKMNIQTHNR